MKPVVARDSPDLHSHSSQARAGRAVDSPAFSTNSLSNFLSRTRRAGMSSLSGFKFTQAAVGVADLRCQSVLTETKVSEGVQ